MVTEKITRFYGCQLTTSNSVKEHKLRKLTALLSDKRTTSKEFVSIYLPAQTQIDETIATLKRDDAPFLQNSNNRFGEVCKSVIQRLKLRKETPAYGLAVFAGFFASGAMGSEVLNVEEVDPPQPILAYFCKLDDHFYLDPLRDMLRDQRIVGFIAMDSKVASFGLLNGGRLRMLETISSGVAGKTGKGGQSQRRYERERDMALTNFFHRVAEHATKAFLQTPKVTVLFVGGPGLTKNDFLKGDYLHYELKNALLNVVDTQSAGLEAIREMHSKTSAALMTMCGPQEKKSMQRLETELNKDSGLAITGLDPVLEGLKRGEVEVALIIDNTDLTEIVAVCKNCGHPKSQILRKKNVEALRDMLSTPCTNCHATQYEVVEKDMIDVLEDMASATNAQVEVIFTESEEKAQLSALGGFAALLRYRPT